MRMAPGWEFASASLDIPNANSAFAKVRNDAGVRFVDKVGSALEARLSGTSRRETRKKLLVV